MAGNKNDQKIIRMAKDLTTKDLVRLFTPGSQADIQSKHPECLRRILSPSACFHLSSGQDPPPGLDLYVLNRMSGDFGRISIPFDPTSKNGLMDYEFSLGEQYRRQ